MFIRGDLIFRMDKDINSRTNIINIMMSILSTICYRLLFLTNRLIPFTTTTNSISFQLPRRNIMFIPRGIRIYKSFFLSNIFNFQESASNPGVGINSASVRCLFLVESRICGTSFNRSLGRANNFKTYPTRGVTPIIVTSGKIATFT